MKSYILTSALLVTSFFIDCAQADPTKVACVGDSITFGYGLKKDDLRYPQVLDILMGPDFEVKGFGNSGKTAGDYPGQVGRWYGSTNEHKQAVDFKADVYVCNLGINDTGAWWDAKLFEKGYNDLVNAWREANPKALFFAWTPLGPDYRGPVDKKLFPGNCYTDVRTYSTVDNGSSAKRPEAEKLIKEVAKKQKIALFDALTPLSDHPEWYVDGLHPTAEGAKRIAEITFAKLARPLKVKQAKPKLETTDDQLTISNPGKTGILLDDWVLTDGTNKLKFENATVIYPEDSITISIGDETCTDPTKGLKVKSNKPAKAFKLLGKSADKKQAATLAH